MSTDNGTWSAALPKKVSPGETLKLHVFLDGSIADIFVNDMWAFSVRLFPADASSVEAEVFATASTPVKASAWTLNAKQSGGTGIGTMFKDQWNRLDGTIFNLQGQRLSQVPQKGFYILNGKKYVNH